ncbi:MAG TPA: hypothetical protein VM890_00335 [Longimicrobium sp.]|nr:hypothetical protein [Longimicrobium sp.]
MSPSAQPLPISPLWRLVSAERIGTYRRGTGDDEEVLARYLWNVALCEALYPSLHFLEVALRNVVFEAAAATFPLAGAGGCWLEHPGILHPEEARVVRAAGQRLSRRGKPCEPGRLVAELSFGFWTALFDVRYEQDRVLWPRLFAQKIFTHAPRQKRSRKALSPLLNRVRHLRNRAFHHEPIWHWSDLAQQHARVVELLGWMSPELRATVSAIDRFPWVHREGVAALRAQVNGVQVAPASWPRLPPTPSPGSAARG